MVEISAKNGTNLHYLLEVISKEIPDTNVSIEALIPYEQQKLVAFIHENGQIISEEYEENGTRIQAKVKIRDLHFFEDYRIEGESADE